MKTSKAGLHLPKAIHAQGQDWVGVWQILPLFDLSSESEIAILKEATKVIWQGHTSFLCLALNKHKQRNFALKYKINRALRFNASLYGYICWEVDSHPYAQKLPIPSAHYRILWVSKLLLACPLTSFNDRQWARYQISKVIKQFKSNLQSSTTKGNQK